MNKTKSFFKKYRLPNIPIIFLILLFGLYLASWNFRCILNKYLIDPNFVVAFITAIGLLTTLNSNKKYRQFTSDSEKQAQAQNMSVLIIGKLLFFLNKGEALQKQIEGIREAISTQKIWVDSGVIDDIKNQFHIDIEKTTACIVVYFGDKQKEWNLLNDKFDELLNIFFLAKLQYEKGYHLMENKNLVIDNSKEIEINKDIEKLTIEIRDYLLNILNKNEEVLQKKYQNS